MPQFPFEAFESLPEISQPAGDFLQRTIFMAGGTGFLGQCLLRAIRQQYPRIGVQIFSRTPDERQLSYSALKNINLAGSIFLNLAGASVGAQRLSKARLQEMLSSRLQAITQVKELCTKHPEQAPDLFVQASALAACEDSNSGLKPLYQLSHEIEQQALSLPCSVLCLRLPVLLGTGSPLTERLLQGPALHILGTFGKKPFLPMLSGKDCAQAVLMLMKHYTEKLQSEKEAFKTTVNVNGPNRYCVRDLFEGVKAVREKSGLTYPCPALLLKVMALTDRRMALLFNQHNPAAPELEALHFVPQDTTVADMLTSR